MTDHESWRKARAEEIARSPAFIGLVIGSNEYGETCARAGMAAEHEVAKLMGRIEALGDSMVLSYEGIENEIALAEKNLKALLASGKAGA